MSQIRKQITIDNISMSIRTGERASYKVKRIIRSNSIPNSNKERCINSGLQSPQKDCAKSKNRLKIEESALYGIKVNGEISKPMSAPPTATKDFKNVVNDESLERTGSNFDFTDTALLQFKSDTFLCIHSKTKAEKWKDIRKSLMNADINQAMDNQNEEGKFLFISYVG